MACACERQSPPPPPAAPAPTPQPIDNALDAYVDLWSRRDNDLIFVVIGFDFATDPPTSAHARPTTWRQGRQALDDLQPFIGDIVAASTRPYEPAHLDPLVVGHDENRAAREFVRLLAHDVVRRHRDGDVTGAAERFAAMIRICRHLTRLDTQFSVRRTHASFASFVFVVGEMIGPSLDVESARLILDELEAFDPVDPLRFEQAYRRTTAARLARLRAALDEPDPGAVIALRYREEGLHAERIAAAQRLFDQRPGTDFWNSRFRYADTLFVNNFDAQPVATMSRAQIEARIDAAARHVDTVIKAMRTDDVYSLQQVVTLAHRDESQILKDVLLGAIVEADLTRKNAVELERLKTMLER